MGSRLRGRDDHSESGGFIFDWETVKQIGPLYCNISGFALSGESLLSWQK